MHCFRFRGSDPINPEPLNTFVSREAAGAEAEEEG